MKIQELLDLISLLDKWRKEHAFCEPHYSTVNKLTLWNENIIKHKVANKEA